MWAMTRFIKDRYRRLIVTKAPRRFAIWFGKKIIKGFLRQQAGTQSDDAQWEEMNRRSRW